MAHFWSLFPIYKKESLKYLEKAYQLGIEDAAYTR